MMPFIQYRAIWASWVVSRILEWGYLGGAVRVPGKAYPQTYVRPSLNHGGLSTALAITHKALLGYPQVPVYMPVDICGTSCGTLGANPCSYVSFVTCVVRHTMCNNRVTFVIILDKVPTHVPSLPNAF
jgi:hypothetical protein